ncbi:MAG: hypothetical protein ACLQUZ_04575 [Rhizomicrobium sp.]
MVARGFFHAGVRLIGVWSWTQAAYWAYWIILKSSGTGLGNPKVSIREDVAEATLNLLIGLFLFVSAGALTWLAYGDAPKQPSAAANTPSTADKSDASDRN